MSKGLKATIEEIIHKREKETLRLKETQGEKERLLKSLEEAFEECLEEFKDYKGHKVERMDYPNIEQVAKELGFSSEEDVFLFNEISIPIFKGGEKTIAQEMLSKFESDLRAACDERKTELADECQRVYKELENGHFSYFDEWFVEGDTVVLVKSKEYFGNCSLEFSVIYDYFEKYSLYLKEVYDNNWYFKLRPYKESSLNYYYI